MTIEKKLEDLGLVLPDLKPPLGAYVPYHEHAGLVFISGQGPVLAGGGWNKLFVQPWEQCPFNGHEHYGVALTTRAPLGPLLRAAPRAARS